MYIHIYTYLYIYTYVYIHIYICIYTCLDIDVYMYMRVRGCVCVCACIHVHFEKMIWGSFDMHFANKKCSCMYERINMCLHIKVVCVLCACIHLFRIQVYMHAHTYTNQVNTSKHMRTYTHARAHPFMNTRTPGP